MKKYLKLRYLPFLTVGAGLLGVMLQFWLYATGIDDKGLLLRSHPAMPLLFVLTLITLLVLGLLAWKSDTKKLRKVTPALCAVSSAIAAVGIAYTAIGELLAHSDTLHRLGFVCGLLAAAGLFYGAVVYWQRKRPTFLTHCAVIVFLILHLICQYRQWSSRPQLVDYCFPLLSSACLMLVFYHRAALEVRVGDLRQYLFLCQAALFFSCLCMRSESPVFYLSMAVWTACNFSPRVAYPTRRSRPAGMFLPEAVRNCISALERAGYPAYVVGGCVRDALLGRNPHDYDLCTAATPEQICGVFSQYQLIHNGEKHGTVGVVIDGTVYEITTFRTEGSYTDGRHPDWVEFVSTIEADLKRRDFTVNAMAYSPAKGFIDPWGGRQDLKNRVLRTVGDPAARFGEDSLRILRGVRFAARYHLTPEPETERVMKELAPLMDGLARERVYSELCQLLLCITANDMKRYAHIITQVIPELKAAVDFDQRSPHHAFDVYTHTAYVVESIPPQLVLKWAALLHDVGKPATFTQDENGRGHFYGHDKISADMAGQILLRLKAPTALRERVVFLVGMHMTPLAPDKPTLRRRLGKYGEAAIRQLLLLQRADFGSKASGTTQDDSFFNEMKQAIAEILQEDTALTVRDLAVDGNDLLGLGYAPGPQIGQCLQSLLTAVQEERLENTQEALLREAERFLRN